jgi:hypothetical protein
LTTISDDQLERQAAARETRIRRDPLVAFDELPSSPGAALESHVSSHKPTPPPALSYDRLVHPQKVNHSGGRRELEPRLGECSGMMSDRLCAVELATRSHLWNRFSHSSVSSSGSEFGYDIFHSSAPEFGEGYRRMTINVYASAAEH